MADYVSASIQIGGKITPANLVLLDAAIMDDGLTMGDPIFGEIVDLQDSEARWGEFEATEQFCADHGLSFRRDNEARYEIKEHIVIHHLGVTVFHEAREGEAVLTLDTLNNFPTLAAAQEHLRYVDGFSPPPLEIIPD
jgi:hypothetical protein